MDGLDIKRSSQPEIAPFRSLFLQENNLYFVHNKCHQYGWADPWIFYDRGNKIGYGALWGFHTREVKDCIFEFYLLPPYRRQATHIYEAFIETSGAIHLECQSNIPLQNLMFCEFAKDVKPEAILFKDHHQTNLSVPGAVFRKKDIVSDHPDEVTGFVIDYEGKEVASGGFFLNYNFPYADVYMSVEEDHFQKGFGGLIVQEIKKEIYKICRIPSARCNVTNYISKSTLMKAGFEPSGVLMNASIRKDR